MDPRKEKAAGCVLAGGALMSFCSLPLMYLFAVAGGYRLTATRNAGADAGTLNLVPLMITLFVVGLLLSGLAVAYGLLYSKRQANGPRRVVADALVLSRYAVSKSNDLLSDHELETVEDPRFFVRMRTPDGRVGEYPVAPEAYFNCAEGMPGEAELQGRWLGRFTPYIGPRPTA